MLYSEHSDENSEHSNYIFMSDAFFEKLKKGMGIDGSGKEEIEELVEEEIEELVEEEEKIVKKPEKKRGRKEKSAPKEESEEEPLVEEESLAVPSEEVKSEKKKIKSNMPKNISKLEIRSTPVEIDSEKEVKRFKEEADKKEISKEKWFEGEGELAIDVYQTEDDLVFQSAIAGVKVNDLDILIEKDIITIKGKRENPQKERGNYFVQECYWGPFSKELVLPVEVDSGRAEATMKDGILTIRMPKIQRERRKKITVIKE